MIQLGVASDLVGFCALVVRLICLRSSIFVLGEFPDLGRRSLGGDATRHGTSGWGIGWVGARRPMSARPRWVLTDSMASDCTLQAWPRMGRSSG